MKTVFNVYLFLLLTLCTIVVSCREEGLEFVDIPEEETIIFNSTVSNLMKRTVMNDGSNDNIIDKSNCFNIKFPIEVEVNDGVNIVVDSEEKFDEIESVFDLFDADEDVVNIVFPVTIILTDYTEVLINNITELNNHSSICNGENEADIDIECVDFQYPIIAKLFNTNSSVLKTISIYEDKELYDFITTINDYDIVSVFFPIYITLSDGTEKEINNLVDLEKAIDNGIYACDEDDDFNFNDDDCNDCTVDQLTNILISCSNWSINNLENNKDEDYYVGYKFNFLADGSITAKNPLYNYSGTWSASGTGNNIVVHIDIPNLPECNNKWILHEMNLKSGEIEFNLYLNNKKLRFGSSCSSDPLSDNLLTQTLINNNWKISHYFNNTNQTSVFSDYTISFSSERGIITSSNPTGDHSGYWNTSTGDHYDLELNINFLNTHNLNELTEDWDVVSVTNTTIKLRDLSREDGTEDLLTLQRI